MTAEAQEFMTERAHTYHDAELAKIAMNRSNKTLTLTFDMLNGTFESLEFHDILSYKISDVTYQNVVSRIFVSCSGGMDKAELFRIFRWICSSREGNLLISEESFRQYEQDIFEGRLILLYLDPSWGAEAGVVCKRISVSVSDRA